MKKLFWIFIASPVLFSARIWAQETVKDTVFLIPFADTVLLDEVVVKAHKTIPMNNRWSDLQPVDLVTVAGANGNLYKALKHFRVRRFKERAGGCWYVAEVVMRHRLISMGCMF